MYTPKISIVIPCYNTIDFIEETINSVFAQDYPDKEIIVRDDCSTDGTWELLLELNQKTGIAIYRNEHNLGMCENWNRLFKDANGDLILKLDADDVLAPGFFKTAISVFNQHNTVDAVALAYDILETSTLRYRETGVHQSLHEGIQEKLFSTIFFKNPFHLCFTIFKRSAITPLINDDNFLNTEVGDLDFLLRFAKKNPQLYYVKNLGGHYRMHANNSSKEPLKQAKSWINDVFPTHQSYLKANFYKDTKKVLLHRVVHYLKNCIYHRQKIDFAYLKVSLATYYNF
ncbi:MAG TPA: glycosyltransferase family 2 protein [Pelobium sp.]|nr:glycosyltransferase family 2 protein [Pelobium sp.]